MNIEICIRKVDDRFFLDVRDSKKRFVPDSMFSNPVSALNRVERLLTGKSGADMEAIKDFKRHARLLGLELTEEQLQILDLGLPLTLKG